MIEMMSMTFALKPYLTVACPLCASHSLQSFISHQLVNPHHNFCTSRKGKFPSKLSSLQSCLKTIKIQRANMVITSKNGRLRTQLVVDDAMMVLKVVHMWKLALRTQIRVNVNSV